MGNTERNGREAVYLRFLELAAAIRGLPGLPALDPLEERILILVASLGRAGQSLSVRELMQQSELGSPATIHARLKSMRQKGWLRLADTEDARRKHVEPTRDALKHFARLSDAMVAATRVK
jgi:DNA-binding MarR family transcriptional regulator